MTVVRYSVVHEGWDKVARAFLCFCKLGYLILILPFMQDSGQGGASLHVISLAFEL